MEPSRGRVCSQDGQGWPRGGGQVSHLPKHLLFCHPLSLLDSRCFLLVQTGSEFREAYFRVEHAGSEMRAFLAVLEGCASPDTLLRFAALVSSPDGYWRAWAPYNSDSSPVPRAFRAGFGFRPVGWEETPGYRGDGVLEAGPRHWMGGRMGISWMEAGPSLACREPSHRAQKLEWGGCDKQQTRPGQQASGW